jgi:hypothetical protein
MRLRRSVALAVTASVAFWTPSIIPVRAGAGPVGCGFVPAKLEFQTIDTAFARPLPVPCPVGHTPSPWPAVTVFVGVASVMVNAAWIWRTQCRELSSQEAITSTFLPFIGMAFDAQANKCR